MWPWNVVWFSENQNFRIFRFQKTRTMWKNFDDTFNAFDAIPACHRQTDRRTDGQTDRQIERHLAGELSALRRHLAEKNILYKFTIQHRWKCVSTLKVCESVILTDWLSDRWRWPTTLWREWKASEPQRQQPEPTGTAGPVDRQVFEVLGPLEVDAEPR